MSLSERPRTVPQALAGQGTMIAVVGPSGAGKDSVMSFAARHFSGDARVGFVRRVITRPAEAGGEVHEAVTPDAFRGRQTEGDFTVSWEAHGLSYGIPRTTLDRLAAGETLVVNGSRSALPSFAAVYPNLKVVLITARADVLAARLVARGRESPEVIARRLERTVPEIVIAADTVVIDNSGPLEDAGNTLVSLLSDLIPARG